MLEESEERNLEDLERNQHSPPFLRPAFFLPTTHTGLIQLHPCKESIFQRANPFPGSEGVPLCDDWGGELEDLA